MTRVNLLQPEVLMDQHLFAEYREIPMVASSLRRSMNAKPISKLFQSIPHMFTLNAGHVTFFYDKGRWLVDRYNLLHEHLIRRGYNLAPRDDAWMQQFETHPRLMSGWLPTMKEIEISKERVLSRVAMKPHWYRMHGKEISLDDYKEMLDKSLLI